MTADTIAGPLDECAAERPNRPLLRDVTGATPSSVSEIATRTSAAVAWLLDAGVSPITTVARQIAGGVR